MTRLDWWHVLGALLMAGSTVVAILAVWAFCAVLVAAAAGWPL